MKHVTSRDNALFKHLKALATSSHQRRKAGQSILDGVHLAQAYLPALGQPELCVVSERHHDHAEVRPLLLRARVVTIDFPDLVTIDSAGLGTMASLYVSARTAGAVIRHARNAAAKIIRVFIARSFPSEVRPEPELPGRWSVR